MRTIAELTSTMRQEGDRLYASVGNPFELRNSLEPGAASAEIESHWPPGSVPAEVEELWSACRSARLFVDVDYGQWGLELLDPGAARARTHAERDLRPDDVREDDVVIGAFLGDLELVVIDASGTVLVALPLDRRADWYRAAHSVSEFFDRYVAMTGGKYWERR